MTSTATRNPDLTVKTPVGTRIARPPHTGMSPSFWRENDASPWMVLAPLEALIDARIGDAGIRVSRFGQPAAHVHLYAKTSAWTGDDGQPWALGMIATEACCDACGKRTSLRYPAVDTFGRPGMACGACYDQPIFSCSGEGSR